MTKRNKIIYWIATRWLVLGMASTAIDSNERRKTNDDTFGLSPILLNNSGIWKLVGVVAILVPKFPLVKEWAYAGFFFAMSGAIFSHLAVSDEAIAYFGPTLLLVLTIVSWYFRPEDRKISSVHL